MYPHRIRLHGPWIAEPLARTRLWADGRRNTAPGPVPKAVTMTPPCRWSDAGLADFEGLVRFRRRFQWVQPLASHERLWLCLGGIDYFATVTLNDYLLGQHAGAFLPFAFDITEQVRSTNELIIDVDAPALAEPAAAIHLWRAALPSGGGLWGSVVLEVRRETCLGTVTLQPQLTPAGQARLHLQGQLLGQPARPLEISLRLDDREVHFSPLSQDEMQQGWERTITGLDVRPWQPEGAGEAVLHEARLELLDTASRLDGGLWMIGFRRVEPLTGGRWRINGEPGLIEPPVIPLREPIAETAELDHRDRQGQPYLLAPPYPPEMRSTLAVHADWLAQQQELNGYLNHRPAFLGWSDGLETWRYGSSAP